MKELINEFESAPECIGVQENMEGIGGLSVKFKGSFSKKRLAEIKLKYSKCSHERNTEIFVEFDEDKHKTILNSF